MGGKLVGGVVAVGWGVDAGADADLRIGATYFGLDAVGFNNITTPTTTRSNNTHRATLLNFILYLT
jgi:hypothetical protein